MRTKSVFVPTLSTLSSSAATFLLRNYLIPFETSSSVKFSSSPAVQSKLSLFSCPVSIILNSSLHSTIELCNYRNRNFPKTRNKFSFYAKWHSDRLLCEALHFVILAIKSAKLAAVFTSLVKSGFIFICSLNHSFVLCNRQISLCCF